MKFFLNVCATRMGNRSVASAHTLTGRASGLIFPRRVRSPRPLETRAALFQTNVVVMIIQNVVDTLRFIRFICIYIASPRHRLVRPRPAVASIVLLRLSVLSPEQQNSIIINGSFVIYYLKKKKTTLFLLLTVLMYTAKSAPLRMRLALLM